MWLSHWRHGHLCLTRYLDNSRDKDLPSPPSSSNSSSFCRFKACLRISVGIRRLSVETTSKSIADEHQGQKKKTSTHNKIDFSAFHFLSRRHDSPSKADLSFCFFSSTERSRSSWAFLYRYSFLSRTSRRNCNRSRGAALDTWPSNKYWAIHSEFIFN